MSATPATRPTIRSSFRFDETDTVLVCDRVKVPWERVFLHNNGAMSRRIYIETPANCYQNHQSNVRFWAKMGLIVGLASRMCQANGVDKIPAVRETLGRLAALEATIGGLVNGQIEACETVARRLRHAQPAHHVCHAQLVPGAPHRDHRHAAHARGRGAAADAGEHRSRRRSRAQGALRALVVDTAPSTRVERLKLYKLAWDLIGSEFAGRHMLYERFYAGNSIIVRNQSDREAPWDTFHATVDGLLERVEVPK